MVVTVHDVGYHYFPGAHGWRQRLYLEWGTRWSVTAATRVIAVSAATALDLQRILGTARATIKVVHEAANPLPQPTEEEIREVRARWGLVRPYALYVGTLQPRKNLVRLMQAYEMLAARTNGAPSFDLVLAGAAGWLSEEIVAYARHSPQAATIHLPGYVAEAELPALVAGAHFFAYPSLYEGFGLPILEAQQLGVPVMSGKGSSLPEVAGDAALYVDPTNVDEIAAAMLRLSQDEALRQELIQAGQRNVMRFSWAKAAAETFAVFEEAVRQRR
jgi:glycosyltransferase involved in cell wall biosynthesis